MDANVILRELACPEPKRVAAALRAVPDAVEELRAVLPGRLAECAERMRADAADDRAGDAFWWMFVAAGLRVPGTHASIVALFHLDAKTDLDRWGDLVTEDSSVIMADTFEGDPMPLATLARDTMAGAFHRNAAMHALVRLVDEGQIDREFVVGLVADGVEQVLLANRLGRRT